MRRITRHDTCLWVVVERRTASAAGRDRDRSDSAQAPPPTGRAHHVGGQLVRVRRACTTHTLPDRFERPLATNHSEACEDRAVCCLWSKTPRAAYPHRLPHHPAPRPHPAQSAQHSALSTTRSADFPMGLHTQTQQQARLLRIRSDLLREPAAPLSGIRHQAWRPFEMPPEHSRDQSACTTAVAAACRRSSAAKP